MPRKVRRLRHASRAGFTLVEVLVVLGILALLASIAIPVYRSAMLRSRRNAAAAELGSLQDALRLYAADRGSYPWFLGRRLLSPLRPAYLQDSGVLHNLANRRLDFYIPWNFLDEADSGGQGFCIWATLDYDRNVKFVVTDRAIYYLVDRTLIPVGAAGDEDAGDPGG